MVHQDWPFGKAECDEHGQYPVRREAYSGRHQPRPAIRNKQTGAQAKSVHDSLSICSTNTYARSRSRLTRRQKEFRGKSDAFADSVVMIELCYCGAN
jgi:hypothetical protein